MVWWVSLVLWRVSNWQVVICRSGDEHALANRNMKFPYNYHLQAAVDGFQAPKSSSPQVLKSPSPFRFPGGSQKILHGQIWTGSSEVAGMAYGSCAKSLASQSSPAPLGDQKQENPWFIGGHTYLEKRDLFMMFNHCCRWCPNAVCCL